MPVAPSTPGNGGFLISGHQRRGRPPGPEVPDWADEPKVVMLVRLRLPADSDNSHRRSPLKTHSFLLSLTLLAFAGCASAPPPSEQIQQKVASLIGEALPAVSPQPKIFVEPTAIRWTIFRNWAESKETNAHQMVPVPDSLVGITFGRGLFLDSQGNLSILPLLLWSDHWKSGVRYQAQVTQSLWDASGATKFDAETMGTGIRLYFPGTFGEKVKEIDLTPGLAIDAIDKRATPLKNGTWQETATIQLLGPVHLYEPQDTSIQHTTKQFTESVVLYSFDQNGVRSSDRTFSLVVVKDHWEIQYAGKQWWLFVGAEKALLIDRKTGQSAVLSPTATGAELVSSTGNQEALAEKKL